MNRQRFINIISAGGLLLTVVVLCFSQAAHAQQTPAAAPAAALFAAFDGNHDQVLSAQEFAAGYASLQRATALAKRMRTQFAAMDTDKSGAIDEHEYAGLLLVKQAGKSAPPLSTFDANGDRTLGFSEYVVLVQKLAPAAAGH